MSRPQDTPYAVTAAPKRAPKPSYTIITYQDTLKALELKLVAERLLSVRLPTIGSITRRLNPSWEVVYTPKGISLQAKSTGISIREGNRVDPCIVKEFLPEIRMVLVKP